MSIQSHALNICAQPQVKAGFFARLTQMRAVWRQRTQLSQLDDHMLDDLGLTQADVKAERSRPIWDVPSHWRH